MKRTGWAVAGMLGASLVGGRAPATAEPFFDLYTGKSFTLDADVRIRQPVLGSDFTVKDLSFDEGLASGRSATPRGRPGGAREEVAVYNDGRGGGSARPAFGSAHERC